MVKFKIGDEVRILDVEKIHLAVATGYQNGDVTTLVESMNGNLGIESKGNKGYVVPILSQEFEFIELENRKQRKDQRIKALETDLAATKEEVAELKLIVQQLRKPSKVVEEAVARVADETIIEFESKQYKKVEREAQAGDVVILRASERRWFKNGVPRIVTDAVEIRDDDGDYFEVYSSKRGRTPETVDVYELIVEDNPFDWVDEPTDEVKSPNQLRAEIAAKAKVFIETSKSEWEGLVLTGSLKGQRHKFSNVYKVVLSKSQSRVAACDVEFIVNEEKRTVVALLRGFENKKVYARGIAKCMPGDVFNEHIGKAIALGRALGLDVSEFEGAVQPNKVVVGQVAVFNDWHGHNGKETTITGLHKDEGKFYHSYYDGWMYDKTIRIINDTNAIYGGVE